jgi:hypothetical protein
MRHRSAPLTFMVFDVLSVDGEPVVSQPTRSAGGFSRSYDSMHTTLEDAGSLR